MPSAACPPSLRNSSSASPHQRTNIQAPSPPALRISGIGGETTAIAAQSTMLPPWILLFEVCFCAKHPSVTTELTCIYRRRGLFKKYHTLHRRHIHQSLIYHKQLVRNPLFARTVQKVHRKVNGLPPIEPENGGGSTFRHSATKYNFRRSMADCIRQELAPQSWNISGTKSKVNLKS